MGVDGQKWNTKISDQDDRPRGGATSEEQQSSEAAQASPGRSMEVAHQRR